MLHRYTLIGPKPWVSIYKVLSLVLLPNYEALSVNITSNKSIRDFKSAQIYTTYCVEYYLVESNKSFRHA